MPPKKMYKRRGSQVTERMSIRARSPEVDELSCVPETQQSQQADWVEELVVGVEDPLEMLDTEQGDIGLETQHESDTSDEDMQDTQAAEAKQKGKGTVLSAEQEQKLVNFLHDTEILYNKRLLDYKDRSKREAKFCEETIWIKMPAKSGSRASAHSSGKSLT